MCNDCHEHEIKQDIDNMYCKGCLNKITIIDLIKILSEG